MEVTITFKNAGPNCDLSGKVRILPGKVPIAERIQKGRQKHRNVTVDQITGILMVETMDTLLSDLASAKNFEDGSPLFWADDSLADTLTD